MDKATTPLSWYVDQPVNWAELTGRVIIRGWCFDPESGYIAAIRLRIGDKVVIGMVGLPRPDVKVAISAAPGDNTGFEIRCVLPAGNHTLFLETQRADGSWQIILEQKVRIRRMQRPRWLGGSTATELIAFQMPAHLVYSPRSLANEKFPLGAKSLPQPKLSIVTPSYQQVRFLGQTVRSVLEQPGVDCDYVVQDGGSSDGSQELIVRFAAAQKSGTLHAPSRFRQTNLLAWTSETDAGQADAIVRGFAKTSGGPNDLMAWINSDDFYLPGTLAYVADYFARHPEVDVIYGHRIVVNEGSQEIARWFLPKHDEEVLRLNDFVPQETMFWRRRIWDRVGGLDPSFKFAMDWDLLLRFQAAGAKIVRVPYFLACFRVHAAQKTSAVMHSTGQKEISLLRERTYGRPFPPEELERNSRLLRYLRRSALIEFLWKLGIRMR